MTQHHRAEDDAPLSKTDFIDGAYKAVKVLGALAIAFVFLATVRERLQAVPVLQEEVRVLKADSASTKEQIAYIVGGMEQITHRKFQPSGRP